MTNYMAELGLRILRNGYEVIPIMPGEKRPASQLVGWNTIEITETLVRTWQGNGFAGYGIGIRTGEIIMLDVDVPDKELADRIEAEIVKRLGYAPVRYGNAPKRGLIYRTDTPFRKIQTKEYFDDTNRKNQFEVLGDGEQFVAFHIHPDTGKPYWWVGYSPETIAAFELTTVTVEQVREVVAWVERLFIEEGLRLRSRRPANTVSSSTTPAAAHTVSSDDDDDDILAGAPLRDLTIEKLRELVEQIPNDGTEVPYESNDHEELAWLQVLMAIAHQTGRSSEGREIAYDWSYKSDKHRGEAGDERFRRTWDSLERLVEERRDKGWRPLTARYLVKWAAFYRREDVREQLAAIDTAIGSANTVDDLKAVAATLKRIKGVEPIDRELRASQLQRASRRIGTPLPIALARNMVRYQGDSDSVLLRWLQDWVFLTHTGQFYNRVTGEAIDRGSFDAAFGRHVGDDTTPSWVAMRVAKIPVFHMRLYLPGEEETVTDASGLRWINEYKSTAPPIPDELSPRDLRNIERVKAHAVHLFGEGQRRDIEILHSALAYIVQTGKRINWLVLIQGAEKIGKTFYANLMGAVLGGEPHIHELDSATLCESPFTDWAVGHQFLYIEELKVHAKRYDVMNKLKPYITNTTVSIHPKGQRQYNTVNTASYFAFTNFRDAVPVTEGDSRYFVMLSQWQDSDEVDAFRAANPKYYERLFAALDQSPGALRRWLLEYKLHPDFDPHARAPRSEGKLTIIEESKPELQTQIEDLIESGETPGVSRDLVVLHLLRDAIGNENNELPPHQAVRAILQRMQFTPIKGNRVKITQKGAVTHFYCWSKNPKIRQMDQATIREIILREIVPLLK